MEGEVFVPVRQVRTCRPFKPLRLTTRVGASLIRKAILILEATAPKMFFFFESSMFPQESHTEVVRRLGIGSVHNES